MPRETDAERIEREVREQIERLQPLVNRAQAELVVLREMLRRLKGEQRDGDAARRLYAAWQVIRSSSEEVEKMLAAVELPRADSGRTRRRKR